MSNAINSDSDPRAAPAVASHALAAVEPVKRRILFVDDEPQVLGALQNLLRRMRASWQMVFVGSGEAALEALAREPFDVVVSDMRMPRMDGVQLLEQVRERHPGVARIILSGYAEPAAMERAIPLAHQFVSKPCDGESLKAVILRACTVRRLLDNPALRAAVGKIGRLPTASAIYEKLLTVTEDEKASVAEIAAIVEQDAAMCAKLLQIVNSAYFGLAARIDTVPAAVVHLGLRHLRGLVLSAHIFSLGGNHMDSARLERLQRDSLITGRIARRLMPEGRLAEQAHTASLVHDVGQIILAEVMPEQYARVVRESLEGTRSFAELERAWLGTTHAQVGGYLLGMWGLPPTIVDAVALHQEPEFVEGVDARLQAVVHFASACVEVTLEGRPLDEAAIDTALLERFGFAPELPGWKAIAAQELSRAS